MASAREEYSFFDKEMELTAVDDEVFVASSSRIAPAWMGEARLYDIANIITRFAATNTLHLSFEEILGRLYSRMAESSRRTNRASAAASTNSPDTEIDYLDRDLKEVMDDMFEKIKFVMEDGYFSSIQEILNRLAEKFTASFVAETSLTITPATSADAAEVEWYTHQPLERGRIQIRVISVLEGPPGSVIQCILWHTDLGTDHSCLSYVCGTDEPSNMILIDGRKFLVRNNLFNFLTHARAQKFDMPIWIDAISMNQSDIAERNHQVQQMWRIYESAIEVLIWVGRVSSKLVDVVRDTSKLRDGIERAADARNQLFEARLGSDGTPSTGLSYALSFLMRPSLFSPLLVARAEADKLYQEICTIEGWVRHLFEIFTSPYWSRLWIVQECLLAKSPKVLTENGTVTIADLYLCLTALRILGVRDPTVIASLELLFTEHLARRGKPNVEDEFELLLGCRFDTFSLIGAAHGWAHCSEPRDKIYGLLGISPKGRKVAVDYAQSLHATVLRVAVEMDIDVRDGPRALASEDLRNVFHFIGVHATRLGVSWTWCCGKCFLDAPQSRQAILKRMVNGVMAPEDIVILVAARAFSDASPGWIEPEWIDQVCPTCKKTRLPERHLLLDTWQVYVEVYNTNPAVVWFRPRARRELFRNRLVDSIAITDLPDEVLLHIKSYIAPSLECLLALSLTCKRFFSLISDDDLRRKMHRRRSEKRVLSHLMWREDANIEESVKVMKVDWPGHRAFGLDGLMESPMSLYSREWFSFLPKFDGSLDWLKNYGECFVSSDAWRAGYEITAEKIVTFKQTAQHLGLTIPAVLETFICSPELCKSVRMKDVDYEFVLGKHFRKIDLRREKWTDRQDHGYIIKFLRDRQEDCNSYFLYFDTSAGFGVVSIPYTGYAMASDEEVGWGTTLREPRPRLTRADNEVGVVALVDEAHDGITLEGIDFEKWLFRKIDQATSCIEHESSYTPTP